MHREVNALGIQADLDSLFLQNLLDICGDVLVFAMNEAGGLFDDGDFATESTEDLAELQADVAATHDDEVTWKRVEFQKAYVCQEGHLVDAGHVGYEGASA